jgi:phage terminase large subunit-like protein
MARPRKLPAAIATAIKSGHIPVLRNWRKLPIDKLTQGEKVCAFVEKFVLVPEGPMVGKPMRLLQFQEVFILSLFDGQVKARKAIMSVGRKSGKTALVASLMIAFMFMDGLCSRNSRINSGALSRDQAALVFNYMSKSIMLSPALSAISKITPSGKNIVALNTGISYHALAAEAGKAMGLSPAVLVGDEWGQVIGPTHSFIDALLTSQGAHEAPLAIVISTQAPSDADWLSLQIDDAIRNPTPEIVCHLYAAETDLDIEDPKAWAQACPAIGEFRSRADVAMQAAQAKRLPSTQASFENLILNRRVALEHLAFAPLVWKQCNGPVDLQVFRDGPTYAGCDLSARNDLTAIVLAAEREGVVHVLPYVFCPSEDIEARSQRDRAPYDMWVRDGQMIPVAGRTMDFDQIAASIRDELAGEGIHVAAVHYDKHMITHFQAACVREGAFSGAEWVGVPQYFKDMGVRLASLQGLMLEGKVRHGGHPLLNMAAANAIAVQGREGISALDKSKATNRIDPLISMVMACWPFGDGRASQEFCVEAMIG